MDNWLGILFGLVVVVLSIASRAAKGGGGAQRRQQWPGPVAGGGFPRPPMRQMPPPPPVQRSGTAGRTAPPAKPSLPVPTLAETGGRLRREQDWSTGEGVSSEGMSDTEGPQAGQDVATELSRFQREIAQDVDVARDIDVGRDVPVEQDLRPLELQRMGQLGSLVQQDIPPEASAPAAAAGAEAGLNLEALLASPQSQAQAIVLAEVLGKPKALREDWV